MKIAVITRHAITYYGSLLQTLATQQVIENLGYRCEIIDYIREDESCGEYEKTLLKQKTNWNQNPLKRILYLALRQPGSIIAEKKFEKNRKQFLNLTRRYTSKQELMENKPEADIYMTGSDQVWGPVADGSYDDVYCLAFTDDKDCRISYAASFGHTKVTPELFSYYRQWLSKYNAITVREDSAVKMIQDLGLNAVQVIDPTLLLDAEYWKKYLKPIPQQKYILVYQLHNNKRFDKYVENVACEMNLPLVRVSPSIQQIFRKGKLCWSPDVGEFLSYIKNAECMITDSFHGVAFAINFNTSFVQVLPNNNTGTRNVSILKLTGLSDRILKNEEDVALAAKKVDFTNANAVLQKQRKVSLDILRKMIEEAAGRRPE